MITNLILHNLSSVIDETVLSGGIYNKYVYSYITIIYTDQNYKRNTFVFAPIFHELHFSMYTKGQFISNIINKSV